MELERELAKGGKVDRKMLIEESFMHANSPKPVSALDWLGGGLGFDWVVGWFCCGWLVWLLVVGLDWCGMVWFGLIGWFGLMFWFD